MLDAPPDDRGVGFTCRVEGPAVGGICLIGLRFRPGDV